MSIWKIFRQWEENPSGVEQIAHTILRAFEPPFELDRESLHVSSSIGIAIYPMDAEDGDTLLNHADQAMYLAKQAGRNGFSRFTPHRRLS